MQKAKRLLWNTIAILGMVCLVLLMSGNAKADSPFSIEGNGSGSKVFYVTANGSCTLTFSQDYGTFMYQTGGTTAKGWGRYHVSYQLSGSSYQYSSDWKRATGTSTFSVTLPQAGTYTVTVTPFTAAEMRQEVSSFGYWTAAPNWSLTGVSNGTASTTPGTKTASCTVYYKDFSNNVLQTRTVSCKQGSNPITAPTSLTVGGSQYTLSGNSTQTVTLYSNGTLSQTTITFYYAKTNTPTPAPVSAVCTVYYKDFSGNVLQTRYVTCTQGVNTITADSRILSNTYTLATASTQTVTLYASGLLSPGSVTFFYNKTSTPTPVPKTATCTVYYKDFSGNTLQTRTVTCSVGSNTISAPSTLTYGGSQYTLSSSSSQVVTLYTSGNLSSNTVTFYYSKASTPTPVATAKCTVYYKDYYNNVLQTRTVTCSVGSNPITAPATLTYGGSQYTLSGSATQTVTLYTNGTLSTNTVTFYYAKAATPEPVSASCTVYCYTTSGSLLDTRTVTCTVGTNTITAQSSLYYGGSKYNLISNSTQYVTMYSNGQLSTNSVSFFYAQEATPTPYVPTATCNVYYRTSDGTLLQSRTVTCSQGNNSISAPATLTSGGVQFDLITASPQTVTLYSNGTLSTNSVTFYYNRRNVTGTVTIRQVDVSTRATLSSRTETLSTGTHTVYAGSAPSGYTLVGSSSASVTVTTTGNVSPSIVTFEYKKNSAPITSPPGPSGGNRVYPTAWDTQFKEGSKNPKAINRLPNLYDESIYTSFYYTFWNSEVKDTIPEITVYFDNATVSTIGIISGCVTSESAYNGKAKPTATTVYVYCDQGMVTKEFSIRRGYTTEEQKFDLGTCTGVYKIEIFFRSINSGRTDANEVHITEIHFYD